MLKLLPQLAEVGYDGWIKALQLIAYNDGWYDPDAEDASEHWEPSDFDPSLHDKKSKRDRKLCFTIMYKQCKGLEYLFEGVKLGDAVGAYKHITRVYNRSTTAAYIEAQAAFTASNMAVDHVDLNEFIALINARAKRLNAMGGAVTERQKCAVLLKGLLTEFEVIKTLIEVKPISTLTYEGNGDALIDFAVSKCIMNLKNGGPRGAKTFTVLASGDGKHSEHNHSCRNWDNMSVCSYGDKCKFEHNGKGGGGGNGPDIAAMRQQRNGKGGGKGGKGGRRGERDSGIVCSYCSKPNHTEAECFSKKNKKNGLSPATRAFVVKCLDERKRGRSSSPPPSNSGSRSRSPKGPRT